MALLKKSLRIPKVNFRQYLTNRHEPVETVSRINSTDLDTQSEEIVGTPIKKQSFRNLAKRLRMRI